MASDTKSAGPLLRWLRAAENWAVARNVFMTKRELTRQLESSDQALAAFTQRFDECVKYEARLCAKIQDLEVRLDFQRALTDSVCDGSRLTPAQLERVAMLGEECGEVVQVCGKILRFGFESCSPFDDKQRPNQVLLERELGHVRAVLDLMAENGDVRKADIASWGAGKMRILPKWTKHQQYSEWEADGDGVTRR